MEKTTTVGLDIAKNVFQVHGIIGTGAVVVGGSPVRKVCAAEIAAGKNNGFGHAGVFLVDRSVKVDDAF